MRSGGSRFQRDEPVDLTRRSAVTRRITAIALLAIRDDLVV
jgi:hypothetical protein